MFDMSAKPFYLDEEARKWVEDTFSALTEDEKIQQLFFPAVWNFNKEYLDDILSNVNPCGFMLRPCDAAQAASVVNYMREHCKVPPLVAANTEKGGNGIVNEGTLVGSPMAVAATNDVKNAHRLGYLCAKEGISVGANLSFAPIIDIDYNFRNPVMNTRTFGSDPKRVAALGRAYTESCQKEGMAVSIKHFPGDGRDERDQHLVVGVNDLSCEEWMESYGHCYKESIEAGALTVMAAHIMQPAWQKRINPELKDEDILPATLSPEMIGPDGLLRKYLGFNGVIITDATTMTGFMQPMSRRFAVPRSIAAGADIFLFNRNLKEDVEYMREGVKNGILTRERLDEAVLRILALKAALKLYKDAEPIDAAKAMEVLGCEQHKQWAKDIADQAITLVKEEPGVLPLDPVNKPRVLFCPVESGAGFAGSAYSVKSGVCTSIMNRLEREGFVVDVFKTAPLFEGFTPRYDVVENNYDYIIYVANYMTKSNQTVVRIEWEQPMGANCPVYVNSVPTIFISVENPYHLLDAPRVKTYINTYGADDVTLDALVDKLMGRSQFKGVSPVDAFCGKWDTRL